MVQLSVINSLDSRHRSAVDGIFDAGDGSCPIRSKERHQLGDFLGRIWTSDRNATERIDKVPARRFLIDSTCGGKPSDHCRGGGDFGKTGRDAKYVYALRPNLIGYALAVSSERCLRGRIRQPRFEKRYPSLNRGDVNNDAGSSLDHSCY